MVNSMTGFASAKGSLDGARWSWEIRSVNARGLDLRLRLPDGLDDLEPAVRKALTARLVRGNITLGLRLVNEQRDARALLNSDLLDVGLAALKTIELRAEEQGLHLTASTAAEILSLKGMMDGQEPRDGDQTALVAALKAQIPALLEAFCAARAAEGAELATVLSAQIDEIERLVQRAATAAATRQEKMAETLKTNLAAILDNAAGADPDRVAQELAMLAVKADIAEELDRLAAHITAAKALLAARGAVGRKFDFLMQEFNREANTLCSKSGSTELTQIGLDLKSVIDQMREQVQNIE